MKGKYFGIFGLNVFIFNPEKHDHTFIFILYIVIVLLGADSLKHSFG